MSEKILIVDDEPEIADLVSLYLQNENFTVYKFYSAIEALNCIGHEKLDMAILDVMTGGDRPLPGGSPGHHGGVSHAQ